MGALKSKLPLIIVVASQNLGNNRDRGSKYVVDSAIFGIVDPDLPIHCATFVRLQR